MDTVAHDRIRTVGARMTREQLTAAGFLWERGLGSDEIALALGIPEASVWNEFLAARLPFPRSEIRGCVPARSLADVPRH